MKKTEKIKKIVSVVAIIFVLSLISALCETRFGNNDITTSISNDRDNDDTSSETNDTIEYNNKNTLKAAITVKATPKPTSKAKSTAKPTATTKAKNTAKPTATKKSANKKQKSKLVVIDAGHQEKGNSKKEPIGPGEKKKKAKVSSGTSGKYSGLNEYELTLILAKKLQTELENRGYNVKMIRTTHKVNISNSERAKIANDAKADAFIRIHANSSDNKSVHGAMTICQTSSNKHNKNMYSASKKLSKSVLNELVAATGCKKRNIWETDTMSGINWCTVPVTIVEVGFMSNKKEDKLLGTEKYQNKITTGLANGIDKYFK